MLRFYHLSAESLWNDELWSWYFADRESILDVVAATRRDVHPPGFALVLYAFMNTLGKSEEILRLPSALAGIASIWGLFALGRRLYSPEVGLLAAALLTVGWTPIYYSQEARSYGLLVLGVEISWLLWLSLFFSDGDRRAGTVLGYAAAALATAYLHYFGLLMVAVQGAAAVAGTRSPRRLLPYGLIALGYLPWLRPMFDQTGLQAWRWVTEQTLAEIVRRQMDFMFVAPPWAFSLFTAVTVAGLALAVRATVLLLGRRRTAPPARADALLLWWIAAPVFAACLVNLLYEPIITRRNLIVILPAVYLLVARTLFALVPSRLSVLAAAGLVAALFWGTLYSPGYYGVIKKEQTRDVVATVLARGPEVPVIGFAWSPELWAYYFSLLGSETVVQSNLGLAEDIDLLDRLVAAEGYSRFWYIAFERQPEPAFVAHLNLRYRLLEAHPMLRASARLYAVGR